METATESYTIDKIENPKDEKGKSKVVSQAQAHREIAMALKNGPGNKIISGGAPEEVEPEPVPITEDELTEKAGLVKFISANVTPPILSKKKPEPHMDRASMELKLKLAPLTDLRRIWPYWIPDEELNYSQLAELETRYRDVSI